MIESAYLCHLLREKAPIKVYLIHLFEIFSANVKKLKKKKKKREREKEKEKRIEKKKD